MIVRPFDGRLELITQPDHARLAADMLSSWCDDGLPDRHTRHTLLFATGEHDCGWTPVDAAPSVNPATDRPFDFIAAPDHVKQKIWPRAVATLGPDTPYAAALVAEHALCVYRQFRHAPAWTRFFADVTRERNQWLERSGEPLTQLDADYPLLRMADLLSLVFCNGWTDPAHAGARQLILSGTTLTVSPDPFHGATVPLRVPMKTIANRVYSSDEDLQSALQAAPTSYLEGLCVGASTSLSAGRSDT